MASAKSFGIEYDGPPLAPRTRYHWAVRLWDGLDQAGRWSGPSWFNWLLENVAGLRNLANGWERILVRPDGRSQVDSASLRTDTVRGRVSVSWRRIGRVFQLEVQVPVGASAEVHVPAVAVTDVTAVPAPYAG